MELEGVVGVWQGGGFFYLDTTAIVRRLPPINMISSRFAVFIAEGVPRTTFWECHP